MSKTVIIRNGIIRNGGVSALCAALIGAFALVCSFAAPAHAQVIIDLDSPAFSPNTQLEPDLLRADTELRTSVVLERLDNELTYDQVVAAEGVELAGPVEVGARALRRGNVSVWATPVFGTVGSDDFATSADVDTYGVVLGADARSREGTLTTGFTLSYLRSDIEQDAQSAQTERDRYVISGFVGHKLTPHVQLRVGGSYGITSSDLTRRPGGGAAVTGESDGDSHSVFGNLAYARTVGSVRFITSGGVTYARNETDAYTESNGNVVAERQSELVQGQVGTKLQRVFRLERGLFLLPQLGATYRYDINSSSVPGANDDRDGVDLTAGVTLMQRRGLMGSIVVDHQVGREDKDATRVRATWRARF